MIHTAFFLTHWFHFFYDGKPWYSGQVWGNVFVIAIVAPLGYMWSKTKFWPLNSIRHGINHLHDTVGTLQRHQHEHNKWVALHIARMHEAQTGKPADPHPHFGDLS